MAASALPETLKSITATKIQELTHQRNNFESVKTSIYVEAKNKKDAVSATRTLLTGTCRLKNIKLLSEESSDDDDEYQTTGPLANQLNNNSLLLRQAAIDPAIPSSVIASIQESLRRDLDLESGRHQHAQFFSELVTEWLSNPDDEARSTEKTEFEEVGRKEMHEQRATWESLVFDEAKVASPKVKEYLRHLFTSTKASSLAYEDVVKRTKSFAAGLVSQEIFDTDTLKRTMAGLLQSDLLSEEKNATLRTFMTNKEVLKEVSDVLNMRYASLSTWKWTTVGKGVPVEMRRQLNGKYRVFMDEDLLDALLLYEIGLKWSVHFKDVLTSFFNSLAWKRSEKVIPKRDRERREFFLENEKRAGSDTVQAIRRLNYGQDYFLTQLPTDELSGKRNYDEDNDSDNGSSKAKGPLELKHGLLHMLVTESLIAKEVNPDTTHTVIRSDFKWFGPALPHETIYTTLRFFGVDDSWLAFFRKFLEAPLCFVHDGPESQVHTRKRGVPMSHTLSDVFGEVVLFVMDFAVNQATSSYLYRLHDDFWLWESEKVCLQGWRAMTNFANTMGIEFNEEKTGTVRFGVPAPANKSNNKTPDNEKSAYAADTTSLPTGEVRWGFLHLDASTGRFLVDQSQVDEHIKELKLQLSYCKSIFSYVQSYNAYVGRFFTNNFGKPSYAFGRTHVDMMIQTFARIQKELFSSGSVTDHLSNLAEERFKVKDLPQGFWYFPVGQGGIELRNPLIPLLGMRESLRRTPVQMLEKCRDQEEALYLSLEAHFKENGAITGFGKSNEKLATEIADSGETFMPKHEFLRYREERSGHLAALYRKFMEVPRESEMVETPDLSSVLSKGSPGLDHGGSNKPGIFATFSRMQPYWKWIVALYGKEVVDRYGSVRMVDAGQVPIGVVSLMKKGRVRWRG